MRTRILQLVFVVATGILAYWVVTRAPARTVYVGGPILTMDASSRVVDGLVVEGDQIVAVGSREEIGSWIDSATHVVELDGDAVLPGFIDAHGHFPGAGIYTVNVDLNAPPIGTIESIDDLVVALAERAAETDAGDWITGMGYDDTLMREGRHPTRDDLDRVSRSHPIVAWHVSLHLAVLNSRALEALGITADTVDPAGGVIRRRAGSSEPDGVLEEAATILITESGPQLSARQGFVMARAASRAYAGAGVTTAQSGLVFPPHLGPLIWMSRLGIVPLRLVLWPGRELADAMLAGDVSRSTYDTEWARVGAVKLVADGSIQGYTGYLSAPYHVPPGDDPTYRGYPRIARGLLARLVRRYHRAGLQVAVHGNGDAAIDDILDAIGDAQREWPRPDARHVIIHAQMARDDQLDRMRTLGVIPSFFSLHTYYWGDRHRDMFMGPERAARMSPARSAAERGLRFTIHCDSPVVPMSPLRLVWAAVNRRSTSGTVIGEDERISPMQALRAVTIDAAHQHFEDDVKGSLEPGKLADLVILSRSPLDDPEHIDEIRVLETIVGGRTIHRAE